MRSTRFIFFCLCAAVLAAGDHVPDAGDHEDAVVVEAEDSQESHRQSKQIFARSPVQQHDVLLNGVNTRSNYFPTGSCINSKGVLGRCLSFRKCYPYFKLPEIGNWDSWVLGMFDTCSYYTVQGRQTFGVCCIQNATETTTENATENTTHENPTSPTTNPKQLHYPQIPNWPPPIPTHPPDHTIPPLPTHPPSPGYPGIPAATSKPPQWPPVTKPPTASWPPKPTKPPAAAWPPASKPPTAAWPPKPATTTTTTRKPPTGPVDASCGAKNGYQDQERIVGGHNAEVGEWPWIAALFNGGRQFCGGSLIDDVHILSAAHCVAHMSSWDVARLTVRLGDHNIRTNSEVNHIEKKVKRVVRHRAFDSRTLYNDIAILTLDSPVQFSQQIRPICLPSASSDYTGRTATVIGWGSLRESGPQPSVLQEVSIPIWSNNDCRNKYGPAAPGGIVEHMLCAGQASRDSCSGDSGGPLMVNTGRWMQVGIVSWGIGCGKGQYPGVYTRVEKFLPWIYKNLKQ